MHSFIIRTMRLRRIRFVLTFCVLVFLYTILVSYMEIDTVIKLSEKMFAKTEVDDIKCYYEKEGDVLPSTEDPSFSPKTNSIFFIDSSCKGKLTMMQARIAESAAIANPQWHIYVLLSYPIRDSISKKALVQLLAYPNVNVARIYIAQFAKGTAVESILANNIKKSKHPIQDTSNILKIVTLNKWGGIFLDNDMIVIKTFDDLPKNFLVEERKGVSSGILSFTKDDFGRNVTSEILRQLAMSYDPKSKRFNHLEAILNSILKRICANVFRSKLGECEGLKIFSKDLFYPSRMPEPTPYFDESGAEERDNVIPYTFPLTNMDFSSYRTDEHWPSESLARIFCPKLYEFRISLR